MDPKTQIYIKIFIFIKGIYLYFGFSVLFYSMYDIKINKELFY
jgi:hypothetical protein